MSAATEKPHGALALIGLIATVCGLPLEFFPWKPPSWGYASFGLFFALLATVSGIATCHLVLAELRTAAEQHKIRRLALAGLVIGYLSIAVYIVMTLLPGGTLS